MSFLSAYLKHHFQNEPRQRRDRARGGAETGELEERERAATGESHSDVTQGAGIFNIHWITKLPPLVRFKDKILTKLSNFIV